MCSQQSEKCVQVASGPEQDAQANLEQPLAERGTKPVPQELPRRVCKSAQARRVDGLYPAADLPRSQGSSDGEIHHAVQECLYRRSDAVADALPRMQVQHQGKQCAPVEAWAALRVAETAIEVQRSGWQCHQRVLQVRQED